MLIFTAAEDQVFANQMQINQPLRAISLKLPKSVLAPLQLCTFIRFIAVNNLSVNHHSCAIIIVNRTKFIVCANLQACL